jgi:hypothetical protein
VMRGRELGTPSRPVHPHRRELFAQDAVLMLAPGDRLPAILRQGFPGKGTGYPAPSPQIRT